MPWIAAGRLRRIGSSRTGRPFLLAGYSRLVKHPPPIRGIEAPPGGRLETGRWGGYRDDRPSQQERLGKAQAQGQAQGRGKAVPSMRPADRLLSTGGAPVELRGRRDHTGEPWRRPARLRQRRRRPPAVQPTQGQQDARRFGGQRFAYNEVQAVLTSLFRPCSPPNRRRSDAAAGPGGEGRGRRPSPGATGEPPGE